MIAVPFVMLIINYGVIIRIALACAKRNRNQNAENSEKTRPRSSKTLQNLQLFIQLKATKKFLMIVGTYLICYGPSCTYYLLHWLCGKCFPDSIRKYEEWIIFFITILSFIFAISSSIIFFWSSNTFRENVKKMLNNFYYKVSRKEHPDIRKRSSRRSTSFSSIKNNNVGSINDDVFVNQRNSMGDEKTKVDVMKFRSYGSIASASQTNKLGQNDSEVWSRKCQLTTGYEFEQLINLQYGIESMFWFQNSNVYSPSRLGNGVRRYKWRLWNTYYTRVFQSRKPLVSHKPEPNFQVRARETL